MKRRDFLKKTSAIVPALGLFPADLSLIMCETSGNIEKRMLGKTRQMLSVIGFGGIVVMNVSDEEAAASVKHACESGINYFDVAPSYGNAEVMLGPALEPYRKNVFLSCKTGKRDRDGARAELEQSLSHMRTSYFDLYQLHAVTSLEDVDTIFAPGGAIETLIEARDQGKVKYLGFSAHSVVAALALMKRFDFDTIMFPFNAASWHAGNFGPQVLETARQKNMGIIALKAMAKGCWPQEADRTRYPKAWYEPLSKQDEALLGLRFTLSHPITTAIPPGESELFKMALKLKDQIKPLTPPEIETLKSLANGWNPLFRFEG